MELEVGAGLLLLVAVEGLDELLHAAANATVAKARTATLRPVDALMRCAIVSDLPLH